MKNVLDEYVRWCSHRRTPSDISCVGTEKRICFWHFVETHDTLCLGTKTSIAQCLHKALSRTNSLRQTLQRNVCRPEEKQEDSNCHFIIPDMFSEKELSSNEKVHYLLSVLGRFSFYTDEKDEDDSSDVQRLRQAVQNYRFGVTNTEPIFNIVCALLTTFTMPWKNSVLNLVRMSCLILSLYHPLSHKE